MSDLLDGTLIDGRYKVGSRIGSGGMADVYLAKDELLSRNVAVKVLQRRFVEDEEFVERFRREASAAAGLSHPNIVAIYDRGSWNGTYYIAMEYLPGRTLKAVVREQGPVDPDTAIDIAVQILHAASFAHRHGVVHRDIKPHNVLLGEEGRATVTDFGIARAGASDMTHTGSIMGTAQYLSPEQAQGHPVSAASDIYAVGILLYELLTGSVPFEGESAVAIALQHLSATPSPPSAAGVAVPSALDAIVLRALAKKPGDRFADADEFIAALEGARTNARKAGAMPPAAALAGAAAMAAPPADATAMYAVPVAPTPAANAYVAAPEPLPVAGVAEAPPPYETPAPLFGDGDASEREYRRRRRQRIWAAVAALALVAGAAAAAILLSSSTAEVTVPTFVGQPEASALRTVRKLHLVPDAVPAASAAFPPGVVSAQRPASGSVVTQGSRIHLTVSTGAGTVVVPKVTGLPEPSAKQILIAAGLNPIVQPQSSRRFKPGIALSTNPPNSVDVQQGATVVLFVSSGPPGPGSVAQVSVPDVTSLSQRSASEAINAAGLTVGLVTHRPSATQPAGTVVSQLPVGGATLSRGGAVDIVIAEAPSTITVPSVTGMSETAAAAALGAAGLTPTSSQQTVSNPAENGTVLEQAPAAGQRVKRGATVTIIVGTLTQSQTTTTATTVPAEAGGSHGP
ncbi:MAG: Stk1 family PASTA domain-containing Ser/Thr kinase [Solirubrobacteraceae bacterium]